MLILLSDKSKSSDANLAGFASFLGAGVRFLDSPTPDMFLAAPEDSLQPAAVALSADTLATMYREENSREAVRKKLLNFRTIFLYRLAAGAHDELLRWLTCGSLISTETVTGANHGEITVAGKRFSHQLSGAQYPRADSNAVCNVFVAGVDGTVPLITVSAKPTFLSLQLGSCNLLVSTVTEIPAPHQRVMEEEEIEKHYDSLLPVLLFVRAACEDSCWQGGYKGARLIIDDPVLRRKYGMLNFDRLIESMGEHRYSATVAFIPWNQPRTSRNMAAYFRNAGERFSICVHGCDHMNNEYGNGDGNYLEQKSLLAMDRMRRHADRTGLGFERIMVFPQGRFSTACFRGLRSSGFLAAINSSRFPIDQYPTPVSLCELLLPAFTRVCGFPVFLRHYSTSTFALRFDLFLGRPAFIVEHHEFFQEGFPSLEALADELNECEPDLAWGPLADSVERTCWRRASTPGRWEVRFFTDTFHMTNNSLQQLSYRFIKEDEDADSVASVVVNGRIAPVNYHNRYIEIETSLRPGETVSIELHRVMTPSSTFVHGGTLYRGKVLTRRLLSEFRDEVLVKYPSMLTQAKRIVTLLKTSSSSIDSKKSGSEIEAPKL